MAVVCVGGGGGGGGQMHHSMTLPYSCSGCMHVLKISMIESVSKEERDFLPSHMTHHVSYFLAEFQFLNESVFLVEMNGSVSLCVQFVSNSTLDKTVLINLSTEEGTASGMQGCQVCCYYGLEHFSFLTHLNNHF